MKRRIYFDHAATTPISPRVLEELSKEAGLTGNPSSLHSFGRQMRDRVESAREEIAVNLGAKSSEVIFTGSGTEANNTAIKGLFWKRAPRKIIVSTEIEHHAVLDPIHWLVQHEGAIHRHLRVDRQGRPEIGHLKEIIESEGDGIALISLIHTNNELGTVIELSEITSVLGEIPLHLDAVQSLGKVDFNFQASGAISAALSAHKVGGPLGVGALLLRHGFDLTPLLHGGGQERDIRSGTLNAPGIIAFAVAIREMSENFTSRAEKVQRLRERMIEVINEKVPDATINGRGDAPEILNVTFPGTDNEASLLLFDSEGIATSTGSACSQGVAETSHVLLGIGLSERHARSSLRFSLSHRNELEEVEYFGDVVAGVISKARAAFSAGNRS
jgi:cysteine desulfurase